MHVHRISNRLNWTNSKNPDETRRQLEEWLPEEHWVDINFDLVGFGQLICEAKKPKCDGCLINDTCPYYINEIKEKKIVSKKISKSVSKNNIKRITEEKIIQSDIDSEKLKDKEEYKLVRNNNDDLDINELLSSNNLKSYKYTSKLKKKNLKDKSNIIEKKENSSSEKLIRKTLPNRRKTISISKEEKEKKYIKRKKIK